MIGRWRFSSEEKFEKPRTIVPSFQACHPRALQLNDAEADKILLRRCPVLHKSLNNSSPENGAPTALMEFVRLAEWTLQRVTSRNSPTDDHAHHSGVRWTGATACGHPTLASSTPERFLSVRWWYWGK